MQRKALDSARPQVLVKVDRSGLNENHPVIRDLRAAIDSALRPIVEAEEKRAESGAVRPGRELRARDQVGLRALNDALRSAFDAPGSAGFGRGPEPAERAPLHGSADEREPPSANGGPPGIGDARSLDAAMRFKQSPLRLRPGEQRGFSILFDPLRVAEGTEVSLKSDPGITARFRGANRVPGRGSQGWARLSGRVRALASAKPGSRLTVTAEAAGHSAELEVLIVRHRASGWVREIARKDVDSRIEAEFDPESGVVTV